MSIKKEEAKIMRLGSLLLLSTYSLLLTSSAQAQPAAGRPALWIWSDKYIYKAGESLTLRWTVRSYGDTNPYTIVAYRQNNQNGKKFYLPAGGEAATDING